MILTLFRVRLGAKRTTGQLYINDIFFCFTLEDVVREIEGQPVEKWKVKNETAIPTGKYSVTLENSPKFGADTITVNKVPGFQGIRIHAGNNENDTEGCVILGYKLNDDSTVLYGTTRTAVTDLKQKIKDIIGQEKVFIDIRNVV